MTREEIEYLSAVLLISNDAARLATYYRDVVGIPLEEEKHGDTEPHFGCELGDLHFAIHPRANFPNSAAGVGSVKLAFNVFDMNRFVARMERDGVKFAYPPKDTGFAVMTATTDPDGNFIEFTQLSEGWFKYLEGRRAKGKDVLIAKKSSTIL
jgi:predicted enzyme related to lactoylglutathione lyase